MKQKIIFLSIFSILFSLILFSAEYAPTFDKYEYEDFETPAYCGTSCHKHFYAQWQQAMMSQAYVHHWDEIEYFKLAVPHSNKVEKLAGIKADCNGCHAPLAYMAGDVPPPRPEEGSRANEAVSCEVCHLITGYTGDTPFNFNYTVKPGKTKYTSRKGRINSPDHEIEITEIHKSGDLCGICHNEKSPFGVWVKSTHLEWKEGPYYTEGVQCQDCHMPKGRMRLASMGDVFDDARLHLFHGAHDPGKIKGTVEIRMYPDIKEVEPGMPVKITVVMFNQKTGHKFPTGSVEDRIVWLHVEATDSKGKVYHLPVDKKGFEGEEFTIGADVLAYQDMGVPLEINDFKGVQRDGIPVGDRIFRMPYFDPQGRMTIQQWNTASLGVDYRFEPRGTIVETYTFNLPYDIAPGEVKVSAVMNYQLLSEPVAKFLEVPEDEYSIKLVNRQETEFTVLP